MLFWYNKNKHSLINYESFGKYLTGLKVVYGNQRRDGNCMNHKGETAKAGNTTLWRCKSICTKKRIIKAENRLRSEII